MSTSRAGWMPPGLNTQIIAVCGKNKKLEASRACSCASRSIEGFTLEIPRFMRLADFFIGKPGPGSISEAVAMGLPVIIERNAWTMVQERFNTDWIAQNEFGIVLPSFREIGTAVSTMLDSEQFARLRANVASFDNRAVFEIPEILDALISHHRAANSALRAQAALRDSSRQKSTTASEATLLACPPPSRASRFRKVLWWRWRLVAARALADLGGLQFNILSADGKRKIGTTSFTVLRKDSTEEIKGETRYLNGERDSEDVRLE